MIVSDFSLWYLYTCPVFSFFFFRSQAEDGIRDYKVTGIQTCALPYRDSPPVTIGAKYPLMSITTSVALLANTSMEPMVPAGTMAALAVTVPVIAFKLEACGFACPVGHVVRYPSGPPGTAVKFSE